MTSPITKDEFLQLFRVGDEFYTVCSYFCRPIGIEGPLKIASFATHEMDGETYDKVIVISNGIYIERFVTDLTNEWNGVFLTESGARECLEARKEEFSKDLEWQRKAREFERWISGNDQL